jgi:hypothetical protein
MFLAVFDFFKRRNFEDGSTRTVLKPSVTHKGSSFIGKKKTGYRIAAKD